MKLWFYKVEKKLIMFTLVTQGSNFWLLCFIHCSSFLEFCIYLLCVLFKLWPVNEHTNYLMIFFFPKRSLVGEIFMYVCGYVCIFISIWFGVLLPFGWFTQSMAPFCPCLLELTCEVKYFLGILFLQEISCSLNCHHLYRLLTRVYPGHFLLWNPVRYIQPFTGYLHLIISQFHQTQHVLLLSTHLDLREWHYPLSSCLH